MIVAVLGLGEAGFALAADLVAAGVAVRGWERLSSSKSHCRQRLKLTQ